MRAIGQSAITHSLGAAAVPGSQAATPPATTILEGILPYSAGGAVLGLLGGALFRGGLMKAGLIGLGIGTAIGGAMQLGAYNANNANVAANSNPLTSSTTTPSSNTTTTTTDSSGTQA
jgi:hypothetical protein